MVHQGVLLFLQDTLIKHFKCVYCYCVFPIQPLINCDKSLSEQRFIHSCLKQNNLIITDHTWTRCRIESIFIIFIILTILSFLAAFTLQAQSAVVVHGLGSTWSDGLEQKVATLDFHINQVQLVVNTLCNCCLTVAFTAAVQTAAIEHRRGLRSHWRETHTHNTNTHSTNTGHQYHMLSVAEIK